MRKVFRYRKGGKVRSLVELVILPDIDGSRPAAYIHKVRTDPEFQGMGIASGLVVDAISYAKEAGCYKVFLVCREKVVPFYERLGFQKGQVEMSIRL